MYKFLVFQAYINLRYKGISPVHLLSASFMSAPASLAIAKIMVPEVEKKREASDSKVAKFEGKKLNNALQSLNSTLATNILEAATIGIQDSVSVVAGVIFSLIAFVSLQSYLDSAVGWFGEASVYLCTYILRC